VTKTIPSFSSAQLTQLAHLLDGPTGSELDRMLREARIPIGEESTKWRRLRESFDLAQRQAGCANPAARFVKLALNPANFTGERQTFEGLRHDANQVLGFSGLRIEDDGTLVMIRETRTLTEAEQRADRLRARLVERGVHPDVLAYCRAELTEKNFFHAVLEASKSVFEKIRERTGLTGDGTTLIDDAFRLANPALLFNGLSNDSERSEHAGLATLAKALCSIHRNPTAHAPKVKWAIVEQDALDLLTIASMLHRRIDDARLAPGAPRYLSEVA
jgi:uncharacterized protein (TIGR02391 family)